MIRRHARTSLTGLLSACLLCGCLRHQVKEEIDLPPEPEAIHMQVDAATPAQAGAAGPISDYGLRGQAVSRPTGRPSEESAEADSMPPATEASRQPPPTKEKRPTPPERLKPLPAEPLPAAKERPSRPPARPDPPLLAALRSVLEKRSPAEVERLLQDYKPAQREMLLTLLTGTGTLAEHNLDQIPPAEMTALVEQLNRLSMSLRPRAALVVDRMCFCRRIGSFGEYDMLPEGYCFQAGRDHRPGELVRVYLEVRNFSCCRRDDFYETTLRGSLEIRDKDDRAVFPCKDLKAEPRRSCTPRQDYYVNLWFQVPAGLPPGLYKLWVEIEDVTPSPERGDRPPRVVRKALDFRVVGPGLPRRGSHRDERGLATP